MTFLPIVGRELRIASRRGATYWVRCLAALLLIVVGTWFFLMMQGEAPGDISIFLFQILTGISVLHCLLRGVWSTADSLSEEKREGTLGLLFLTDLKGYDVVLGKLAATSLNGFYSLMAAVPMMAIPLLMGGVTPGEFGRMSLVAVNTLFFSLTLGICASAMSRSARNAMSLSFLVIFGITAVVPAFGAWLAQYKMDPKIAYDICLPTPGFSYFLAFDKTYKLHPGDFLKSVLIIHGMGWIFFALACLIAPRSWQDRPAGARKVRVSETVRGWTYGNVGERSSYRRRLLSKNAYFWLAARARLKPMTLWFVLGLIACGWTWGVAKFHRDWFNEGVYVATGIVLNMLLKMWFCLEAGQQISEDRKNGALELLLSTPLSVRNILRGQFLSLQRQFLWPLVAVLVVFALFMFGETSETLTRDERNLWVLFWLAAMLMLVADLVALYWVCMWQALTARNPTRAASQSFSRVLILPWLGFGLVSLVIGLATLDTNNSPGPGFFIGLWAVLGLIADIAFGLWARHKLLTDFRAAAARRFSAKRGFWSRILRRKPSEEVPA